jgi:hypothetical protein
LEKPRSSGRCTKRKLSERRSVMPSGSPFCELFFSHR